jgi:hypothetical protein
MLLFQWIERVGRVVAPDENYYVEEEKRASEPNPLLSIVAPDPNFTESTMKATSRTPSNTTIQSTPRSSSAATMLITSTPRTLGKPSKTPSSNDASVDPIRLASQQLEFIKSPKYRYAKQVRRLFSTFMLQASQFEDATDGVKLRKFIAKYPNLLLEARSASSAGLGCAVPEGYTPLMAACHVNLLAAARILLEHEPEVYATQQLQATNFSGQTPLHIAADKGHEEIVSYLTHTMRSLGLSLDTGDVLGRTPLGAGLASPAAKRRRGYQNHVMQELFSPTDPSIVGTPLPMRDRSLVATELQATVAVSEMPGVRVDMEDATIAYADATKIIVGVCDGHDDGGLVSEFVSDALLEMLLQEPSGETTADDGGLVSELVSDESLETSLKETSGETDWASLLPNAFVAVDEKLRAADISGGSTCVTAVVTSDTIFVANGMCVIDDGGGVIESHVHLI